MKKKILYFALIGLSLMIAGTLLADGFYSFTTSSHVRNSHIITSSDVIAGGGGDVGYFTCEASLNQGNGGVAVWLNDNTQIGEIELGAGQGMPNFGSFCFTASRGDKISMEVWTSTPLTVTLTP
jgi:hypothetical protein